MELAEAEQRYAIMKEKLGTDGEVSFSTEALVEYYEDIKNSVDNVRRKGNAILQRNGRQITRFNESQGKSTRRAKNRSRNNNRQILDRFVEHKIQ